MTQKEIYSAIKMSSRSEAKAIELISVIFFDKVQTIVLRHGLSSEDAQDIFQDCIIDLCFKIKQGSFILMDEKSDGIQRYILRYVKYKCLNERRKVVKFNTSLSDNLMVKDKADVVVYNEEELLNRIFTIANSKSRRGAEVLKRRFLDEQSFEEITAGMSYTANSASARNQLHRIIKEIRKENINLGDYIA